MSILDLISNETGFHFKKKQPKSMVDLAHFAQIMGGTGFQFYQTRTTGYAVDVVRLGML